MRLPPFLSCLTCLPLLLALVCATAGAAPSDAEIRALLQERIEVGKTAIGLVVGVANKDGMRIISAGRSSLPDGAPVNGDTVFEIGSVSKVLTTTLLAEMAGRGEVRLDDPVAKYLPEGVRMPQRGGRQITLADLATHHSGLPRLPDNLDLARANPEDPWAGYDTAKLYAFLNTYTLPRDVGAQFEYSNLGNGLLGHVLALRAGMDYGALMRERVLEPLGMLDTALVASRAMRVRLAPGHNQARVAVQNWDMGALAAAGGFKSTANDMLRFMAAYAGLHQTILAPAMQRARQAIADAGRSGSRIGLGWLILDNDGRTIVWHNGATGGYRSYAGFRPDTGEAVVILSNLAYEMVDLGHHLLDQRLPLAPVKAPETPHAISMAPEQFEPYLGSYQMAPNFVVRVFTEDERFYAQATGQGSFEIFSEGGDRFFATAANIRMVFARDGEGKVIAMNLLQNGQGLAAPRVK